MMINCQSGQTLQKLWVESVTAKKVLPALFSRLSPTGESLLLAMGDSVYLSVYLSVSDTLRISEFWNILEHSTETV